MKNYNPLHDGDPKPHVRSLATKFRASFESRDLNLRRKIVKNAEKFSYEELCELWIILARTPISEPAAGHVGSTEKVVLFHRGNPLLRTFLLKFGKKIFDLSAVK